MKNKKEDNLKRDKTVKIIKQFFTISGFCVIIKIHIKKDVTSST